VVHAGVESCDDGNIDAGDGCSANCVNEATNCTQINDPNGYQVIIVPGRVVLGPNNTHAVRCRDEGGGRIRIYETSDFDCLRFAPVGVFAGRGPYSQSILAVTENRVRICNALGYANSNGASTGVNGSTEAVIDADMNGFTTAPPGVDWLWIDCWN
jgi:cysteine-rich repeat protein